MTIAYSILETTNHFQRKQIKHDKEHELHQAEVQQGKEGSGGEEGGRSRFGGILGVLRAC
jgi:hypothetical protein